MFLGIGTARRPPRGLCFSLFDHARQQRLHRHGWFASRYEHFKKLVKAAPNAAFTSDYHQEAIFT
jgi:hypothetical protein